MSGEVFHESSSEEDVLADHLVGSIHPSAEPQIIWRDPDSAIVRNVLPTKDTLNPDLASLDPAIAQLDAQGVMLDPEAVENITTEQFKAFIRTSVGND